MMDAEKKTKPWQYAVITLMVLEYVLIRMMYAPAFWVGVPAFEYWIPDAELIRRDTRRLFSILILAPLPFILSLPNLILVSIAWLILNIIVAQITRFILKRKRDKIHSADSLHPNSEHGE